MNKNVIEVTEVAEGTTVKCAGCNRDITVSEDVAKQLSESGDLAFCHDCMVKQFSDNNVPSAGTQEAASTIDAALGK